MTREEAERIRKGDVLTIRVVADKHEPNFVRFEDQQSQDEVGTWGWVRPKDILSVTPTPREIKVGDWVRFSGSDKEWLVLAIKDDGAWIRRFTTHRIELLSDLRHADTTEGHAP